MKNIQEALHQWAVGKWQERKLSWRWSQDDEDSLGALVASLLSVAPRPPALTDFLDQLRPSTLVSIFSDLQSEAHDWDDDAFRRALGDALAATVGSDEAAILLLHAGLEDEVPFVFPSDDEAEQFMAAWDRQAEEELALYTKTVERLQRIAFAGRFPPLEF